MTAFHYYLLVRELRASSSSCRIHRLAKNCSYIQWQSKNQSKTAENTKNYMEARKTCLIFHKIKKPNDHKKSLKPQISKERLHAHCSACSEDDPPDVN